MPIKQLRSLREEDNVKSKWKSTGVRGKPTGCKICPYQTIGIGFCPDELPARPILGVLLEAPGRDDVIEQRPMSGKAGKYWEYNYVRKLGYERKDVAIFNTIRCLPPDLEYPQGGLRVAAEKACRQYDRKHGRNGEIVNGGIIKYNPNLFIATFHPAAVLRTPPLHRLVVHDMEKAFAFAAQGFRPLVLMGEKALTLVAPWASSGGMKTWRSHVWEGSWPFDGDVSKEKITGGLGGLVQLRR